jgi:hypothetical protein
LLIEEFEHQLDKPAFASMPGPQRFVEPARERKGLEVDPDIVGARSKRNHRGVHSFLVAHNRAPNL